jgi:type IV pilus assembly protein PilM
LALESQSLSIASGQSPDVPEPVQKMLKFGARAGRVVVNVPGSVVRMKRLQIESTEMDHLQDWVLWEAKQYLPGPLDDYFIDFERLKPGDGSDLWDILLIIARRDTLRERARLFHQVNIKPTIMDVDSLALQNAFEENYPGFCDSLVALINVEQDLTTLVATQRGVPEAMVTMETFPSDDKPSANILGGLSQLLQRIERHQSRPAKLEHILLSGGGPQLPEVANEISSRGEVEMEWADPFRELAIVPSLREKLEQNFRASEFMLATGLALRRI